MLAGWDGDGVATETDIRRAYGWRDFDQEVVEGLVENDSRFINRRSNGWILSPLVGHYDTRLAWKDDNYKKGSVPVGDPPVSFRAAPTYVLEEPLDNVIAGRELFADAIAGTWGHAEANRLGNETSEGALTWNVLRFLQEADRLGVVASALTAGDVDREPELGFWGQRIEREQAAPWAALQGGPDACLRVPGWGWILIDARFGGGTDTLADAAATEAWIAQYSTPAPGLFDDDALRRVRVKDVPLPHPPDDRLRPSPQSRGRAGGRRRPRARERIGRSRAVGRPLPRGHGRCRASAASPGSRSTRRSTRTTTSWRRSARTSRTRATASAPRSPSTRSDDEAER